MAAKQNRGGKALRRRVAVRKPRKTLLVFCEGQITEPEYLEALRREPVVHDTAAVDIRVQPELRGCTPVILVNLAVNAKSGLTGDGEIDEFWCVFDVEWPQNHPHLQQALDIARHHDIRLAISNPCFELWLIVHFQDQSAWLDTASACRLRRRLDGSDGKGVNGVQYMSRVTEAAERAVALEERHAAVNAVFPHDNPSSGMYRLIRSVTG